MEKSTRDLTNCKKELGSFPGLHYDWHSSPLASFCLFPLFLPLIREFCHFTLLYYRLTTPLQEYTQHQQWHALFQQQKGKHWGTSFEKTLEMEEEIRLIDCFGRDLQPSQLQWECYLHKTQKIERCVSAIGAEMSKQALHMAALGCQDWWGQHSCFCANVTQISLSLETTWPHFQVPLCKPSHFVSGCE